MLNQIESDDSDMKPKAKPVNSAPKQNGKPAMGPASKKKKPNYAESDDEDFNDISPPSSPEVKKKKESPKAKPKMGPKSKKQKPSYVDSDDSDNKFFDDSPPASPEVKKKKTGMSAKTLSFLEKRGALPEAPSPRMGPKSKVKRSNTPEERYS